MSWALKKCKESFGCHAISSLDFERYYGKHKIYADWVFIENKRTNKVELYDLLDPFFAFPMGIEKKWPSKGFSWEPDNLHNKLKLHNLLLRKDKHRKRR